MPPAGSLLREALIAHWGTLRGGDFFFACAGAFAAPVFGTVCPQDRHANAIQRTTQVHEALWAVMFIFSLVGSKSPFDSNKTCSEFCQGAEGSRKASLWLGHSSEACC